MTVAAGISADAFLIADRDGDAELVDGEVVVNDPTLWHQRIAGRLFRGLDEWCEGAGRGLAGFGGNWVLAEGHVYKPDVWWVANAARLDLHAPRTDGAPDLAVEVRSPGTWHLETGTKRSAYESAGAAELWHVDWPTATVLVHRRSAPGVPSFDVSAEAGPGEVLTSPMLEGFATPIDGLFA